MTSTAHVRSIDSVERFRAAFSQFGEESGQALDEIRMELDRFVEWLEHDQTAYWKNEVRRCEAKVAEATVDLHRARSATIDPEHTPACLQEQKVLQVAKQRLLATEEKLQLVKRWVPAILQAARDYHTQIAPLVNYLTYEHSQGVNQLRQLIARLGDYLAVAPPTAPAISSAAVSIGATAGPIVTPTSDQKRTETPTP